MHLQAEVNWHQLFMGLIQDFDVTKLERRQTDALQAQDLPLPS
jgi:hypothetical protein